MDVLAKLEKMVLGWVKDVPHLPAIARNWLGTNIWWIILILAIIGGISVLFSFTALMGTVAVLGSVAISYYAVATVTPYVIAVGVVGLTFLVLQTVLLALAVSPLKEKQKKGWVLLFASWLLNIISVVVNAVLTLNPLGLIIGLLFGAIGIAITGYFLLEIHGQFAHVTKSKGVKAKKA
jgi:hypothetical protein